VQKRLLPLALIGYLFVFFINWGCTKLDTTTLGSDLIPAVDNVHTFADTLLINTTLGVFADTTTVFRTENHVLGKINNDPLFGQTTANIFMQLKPSFFPFYYGNTGDTLNGFGAGLDSVVLCLSYKGFWGDSTVAQQLTVNQIVDNNFRDSITLHDVNYSPSTGAQIGAATFDIRMLGNIIKYTNRRDSVQNQIRIKLDPSFASQLYSRDSVAANTMNNALLNDSVFRQFYNGLAIKASGSGNALMYVNLGDTNTKLEVHFRRKNAGKLDTVYNSFKLISNSTTSINASASANNIIRNRPAFPPNGQELFLQTTPGTFANLAIPQLTGYSNRIIHRAQIIVEQIPDNLITDSIFSAPSFMYLDLKDSGANKWKPLYIDLNPNTLYDPDYKTGFPFFPTGGIDYGYFGGYGRKRTDASGRSVTFYELNVTRYVQRLVTQQTPNYILRLFPAYNFSYPQYTQGSIAYDNPLANGRVKVGSGSHPDPNKRMRLVIIYSKI